MTPNLSRFIEAQDADNIIDIALIQIKNGKIEGSWMPFIFPQIYNIEMSYNEKRFAFYSLYEAEAYMCDDTLAKRLCKTASAILSNHYGCDIESTFGYTNSRRIKSCMTLFDIVNPGCVFEQIIDNFFEGKRDENVLEAVKLEQELFHGESSPYEKANLRIVERAMFDGYGEETTPYSVDEKIASYLRLYKMGYTPLELGRIYLVNHCDIYDHYRTSGMESYLEYIGQEFLFRVYDYTQKNCSQEVLEQFVAQYDLEHYFKCSSSLDWEIYAIKLEFLLAYVVGNPNYDEYLADFEDALDKGFYSKKQKRII